MPNDTATSTILEFSASALPSGEVPMTSGIPAPSSQISINEILLALATLSASSAVPSSNSPSKPSSAPRVSQTTGSSPNTSGLGIGGKAGVGVGCAIAGITILVVAFWIMRRRRIRRNQGPSAHEISPPEKELAAELAAKTDHPSEALARRAENPAATKLDGTFNSSQELEGETAVPELEA